MSNLTARINSRLYFDLYTRGGDKLIAVYSILKTSREGLDKYYSYTSKNNKTVSGYSLLRSKTTLTLHTIKNHVPTLIEMGLCSIESNGNVYILGGEKIKELYNSKKLVPVLIGKNFTDTALGSFSVRLFAKEKVQQTEINKKQYRSELLKQASNPTNYKLYKKAKRLLKKLDGKEITIIDTVILSNQGYAYLKNGAKDKKSNGQYWKKKLISKGLVESKRRFTKLREMTFDEYKKHRHILTNKRAVYRNGFLCQEEVSAFHSIDLIPSKTASLQITEELILTVPSKKVIKPLQHLSFDMVAWWSNN